MDIEDTMQREEIEKLLKEKEKRNKLASYAADFSIFAKEQVRLLQRMLIRGLSPSTLIDVKRSLLRS